MDTISTFGFTQVNTVGLFLHYAYMTVNLCHLEVGDLICLSIGGISI
jgi:hypothetical protein